jgi:D-methionine transport system substrate-binding protein
MLNRRSLMLTMPMLLCGCGRKKSDTSTQGQAKTVKFIMSDIGFNGQLAPILKQELAKQGFVLDWVVVNDIIQPNEMVDAGEADANSFQHEAYFDQFVQDHGLKNVVRGFYTVYIPSGLYSKKYKSLKDVPDGALFGVPVDPANNGRALFMLQDHGLLTLRPGVDVVHASLGDIVGNPHHFKFLQVDQQMLQRTYQDVDVAFLFALYAKQLGLDPIKDALAVETLNGADTPYKGIVAINRADIGDGKIKALQTAYSSDAVKSFYRQKYGDAIIFLDNLNHTTR